MHLGREAADWHACQPVRANTGDSVDSPLDDAIAILVVAVFSGVFFWSLYEAARRPGRYHALMNNLSAWRRIKWSIAAITVGVAVALRAAGASEYTVGIVGVIGFSLWVIARDFTVVARGNEWLRRFFGE
jgi:hypothetical protein